MRHWDKMQRRGRRSKQAMPWIASRREQSNMAKLVPDRLCSAVYAETTHHDSRSCLRDLKGDYKMRASFDCELTLLARKRPPVCKHGMIDI